VSAKKLAALVALIIFSWSPLAMSGSIDKHPPATPEGESPIIDEGFASECASSANERATHLGWVLGKAELSSSAVWGKVYRVEFILKGQSADRKYMNQFVCWRPIGHKSGLGTYTSYGNSLSNTEMYASPKT
jgi:hypothetical protein